MLALYINIRKINSQKFCTYHKIFSRERNLHLFFISFFDNSPVNSDWSIRFDEKS